MWYRGAEARCNLISIGSDRGEGKIVFVDTGAAHVHGYGSAGEGLGENSVAVCFVTQSGRRVVVAASSRSAARVAISTKYKVI